MEFFRHIIIAGSVLAVGAVIAWFFPAIGEVTFAGGAVLAQLWLFYWAIKLRRGKTARFDMVVASELIIAFGVLSLIIGIVISVTRLTGGVQPQALTNEVLRPLLLTFAGGLFAAGLAPVLATILRLIETLWYGGESRDASIAVEVELDGVKDRFREVTRVLGNFATATERSQKTFEKSATSFNRFADVYDSAGEKVNASLNQLANAATAESTRIAAGFAGITKELSAYQNTLIQSSRQMNTLITEIRSFQAAVEDGTALLDGLNKLIDSVEHFIRPDS